MYKLVLVGALLFCDSLGFAQTSSSANASTPAADSVLSRAQSAFSASTVVTDVRLEGTATSYAGSTTRSGPVTLVADSQGRGKVTYSFDNGTRSEYSSGHSEQPDCAWTNTDGKTHQAAMHNCWTPGNWFLPTLSYAAASAGKGLEYSHLGRENRSHGVGTAGVAVEANSAQAEHVQLKRTVSTTSPATWQQIQELSAAELFLDPVTALPRSMEFKMHPDDNLRISLPVEIKYSDYRDENGVKVPFHLQRFVNGALELGIVISSVSVNSGLKIQKEN